MNNKPKVALFYGNYSSLIGALIRYTTKCPFVHAAVYIPDRGWFHSSESVGYYSGVNVAKYMMRRCIVFEIDSSENEKKALIDWHENMLNKPYDWVGIIGWATTYFDGFFKKLGSHRRLSESLNSQDAFYCFEAARDFINKAGVSKADKAMAHTSGCSVSDMFRGDSAIITKKVTQSSGLFADYSFIQ